MLEKAHVFPPEAEGSMDQPNSIRDSKADLGLALNTIRTFEHLPSPLSRPVVLLEKQMALVYLVVSSPTRETHLFPRKGHLWGSTSRVFFWGDSFGAQFHPVVFWF